MGLKRRLDWLKPHLFSRRSERRLEFDGIEQAGMLAALGIDALPDVEVPMPEVLPPRAGEARGNGRGAGAPGAAERADGSGGGR